MTTVSDIFMALEQVLDPELGIGIVPLGLVYDVKVLGEESDRALVTMTLTSPMCPAAPMIKQNVIDALSAVPGVSATQVEITFSPPWDPRLMADDDVKVILGIW